MKLSTRLAWWFSGLLALALLIVLFLAYREIILEQGGGHPEEYGEEPEPPWWQIGEIALRSFVPLALLAAGGWWITRRSLRPLETLTEAASRIHAANLRERIPSRGTGDELDRLTTVFNDMTSRLGASFDRIREFTLHASHELMTPLAILRADFGELVNEPGRSEADRERFASHLDEIERLTRIVNGLTLLSRADAQQVTLRPEHLSLDALVREAAENTLALAEPRGITVVTKPMPAVEAVGDRHRLRQLLLILCDNAVKYNRPQGQVSFELACGPEATTVIVRNTGPGIPTKDQPRVFERFYRGASAMSEGVEGCGLGLPIALWIAQAHGGALTFASEPDATEFVFTLPLHPAK